ncbi:hypothetical protein PHJA_000003000 [Phtheirospermum japonicum]|uniref:Fiber protein Fb34 n=1 Tax=Phtheirospermum japonicum TaxID=374723 RepID=A0A830B2U1_9LAMI|nr:hypothetical protein PHJA_000003000 [Phtheirospermum japonicum]
MASKLLLITVFIFDLIAFGLAVAAEQRRSTGTSRPDSEDYYRYCVYDSDIATGYGVGAFLFLMASQLLIMVASRCFCCGTPLRPAGSVRNAYHTKYRTRFFENPPSCETVRKGVFAAGAAFVLFTGIISEFYYVSYSKARGGFGPHGVEAGVGMAAYK